MSDVRSRKPLARTIYSWLACSLFFSTLPSQTARCIYLHSVDLHSFRISCVITSVRCVKIHLDWCIEHSVPPNVDISFNIDWGILFCMCKWRSACINNKKKKYLLFNFVYRKRSIKIKRRKKIYGRLRSFDAYNVCGAMRKMKQKKNAVPAFSFVSSRSTVDCLGNYEMINESTGHLPALCISLNSNTLASQTIFRD